MDSELIIQALNYHGQEFRRALDSAAPGIFENVDMREVDYLQYHRRAKEFGFQERKRRQKLHKFLGRKAHLLYTPVSNMTFPTELDSQSDEMYAVMPPLETYVVIPGHERRKQFFEIMKKGDPVIGMISAFQNGGFVITLICTDGGKRREIHDLGIKCICTLSNALINNMHDNAFSSYKIKDLVRGAVINEPANPSIERLYISMKIEHLRFQFQNKIKMGLIGEEDLPIHYRRAKEFKDKSYSEILEWNLNFSNPTNIYQIGESLGLNTHNTQSFLKNLHSVKYGKEEYACAVRKLQSAKWAFKSIRDGVTQFKAGNHIEAFQCLNKALHIDPDSVEGLVARGALFANNNNLVKAVDDFERALELNPQHGNAQKYLSETLVAIGKSCHEKGDIEEACKNYKKAISINDNDEAKEALASAEKSLNSKDTVANTLVSSSSNNTLSSQNNSTTTNLAHADTRQKLLFLLKDDKEKVVSKDYSSSSSDRQSSSPGNKTSPLLSSPKRSASEGTKSWFSKDGMKLAGKNIPDSLDRKDIFEKRKSYARMQDHKDQLSSKKHQQHSENNMQFSPASHKIPTIREKEILPRLKHDSRQLQKQSSSKNNDYEQMNSYQLENIFGKDGMQYVGKNIPVSIDRRDMYEKKKMYENNAKIQTNRCHLFGNVEARVLNDKPVSLEERLKEYYKKVDESGSPTGKEVSPEESYKMSKKLTKYAREFFESDQIPDNTSLRSSSFSTSDDSVNMDARNELWNEQAPISSKYEHKRRSKILPFSDHCNSSCKRPKTVFENSKETYLTKKKPYKTINSENYSVWLDQHINNKDEKKNKETKRSHELVTEESPGSYKLNISHRNLEPSVSTSGHYEHSVKKSHLADKNEYSRKYNTSNICRKSGYNNNHIYNNHKHSYNTSSRSDAHSSPNHYRSTFSSSHRDKRSHSSENKHLENYQNANKKYSSITKPVKIEPKQSSFQALEINHRKDRGMICRALSPEKLRELREAARLSRISSIQSKYEGEKPISYSVLKTEENSALEAAMAAAQKINEQLQDTITPPSESHDQMDFPVMSAKQRETLHQMEIFLEKLKSQKKTETFSNSK